MIITGQGITNSYNSLRICKRFMVSGAQNHIGNIGKNWKTMSWAALPLLNETSQVKLMQTVWPNLSKVTHKGNSSQYRSVKRKALWPCRSCHRPCMGEDGENKPRAVKTWWSATSITAKQVSTKFSSWSYRNASVLWFLSTKKCFSIITLIPSSIWHYSCE